MYIVNNKDADRLPNVPSGTIKEQIRFFSGEANVLSFVSLTY